MNYNVYDFDGTIYNGDSTLKFYLYCIRRFPKCLKELPRAVWFGLKYKLKLCSKTEFKENFYRFLLYIPQVDKQVEAFWDMEIHNIKSWYLDQKQEADIIITASPEFLIRVACNKLGIKYLIGSKVDKYTGRTDGENCHGVEKARRLNQAFQECNINKFYSDSYSDKPLAEMSMEGYLVKGNNIIKWL